MSVGILPLTVFLFVVAFGMWCLGYYFKWRDPKSTITTTILIIGTTIFVLTAILILPIWYESLYSWLTCLNGEPIMSETGKTIALYLWIIVFNATIIASSVYALFFIPKRCEEEKEKR